MFGTLQDHMAPWHRGLGQTLDAWSHSAQAGQLSVLCRLVAPRPLHPGEGGWREEGQPTFAARLSADMLSDSMKFPEVTRIVGRSGN